jgi:hypothetical protein
MRRGNAVRAVGVGLLAFSLVGCSFPSDYFGNRAIEYNREAEDATLAAMLLNIVRAAQRRPMQFTGLQSVTGTSSTSGSIGGADQKAHNTPYLLPPSNTILSRAITTSGNASASISGGPTFTVPILDTQEFYQGILTPVPLSVIDFFIQEGFPPELLADLFILSIDVTRIDDQGDCQRFLFRNDVASDLEFGQFQALIDYLIASGFVAERVSKSKSFGSAIPLPRQADAARSVDAYAHAAQAGLEVSKDKKTGKFNLEKKSSELRTCFAYKGGAYPEWLKAKDTSIFCGHSAEKEANAKGGDTTAGPTCIPKQLRKLSRVAKPAPTAAPYGDTHQPPPAATAANKAAPTKDSDAKYDIPQGAHSDGKSEFRGIALAPEVLKRIKILQQQEIEKRISKDAPPFATDVLFPVDQFRDARVSLKFTTRSTEAILYYLGEIVRRKLAPEFEASREIKTKLVLNYGAYPMQDCDDQGNDIMDIVALGREKRYADDARIPIPCQNIFIVTEGPWIGDSVVSVTYNGVLYSIPHSLEVGGRSSQVTELVKQILNLNTSAKQLPTTTVISVVGAQ